MASRDDVDLIYNAAVLEERVWQEQRWANLSRIVERQMALHSDTDFINNSGLGDTEREQVELRARKDEQYRWKQRRSALIQCLYSQVIEGLQADRKPAGRKDEYAATEPGDLDLDDSPGYPTEPSVACSAEPSAASKKRSRQDD